MNARWHFQLVHDFDVKSVVLLWGISVRAVGLLDSDNGYLFTHDFEWDLSYEEPHALRTVDSCIPN